MVCLALNASPKSYTRRKAELLRSTKSANCLQLTLALLVDCARHCWWITIALLYGLAAVNDGLTVTTATGLLPLFFSGYRLFGARFERVL